MPKTSTPDSVADQFPLYTHLPQGFDLYDEPLSQEIWARKYRWGDEQNMNDTAARVVKGVYAKDGNKQAAQDAYQAIAMGLFMPGGRILAGAGTDKHVTLFNCYVNEAIEDSVVGIHKGYGNVMTTMQQGGGIGTDFTPIRPKNAWLGRTKTPASGPIPFAIAQNSIGETIESAGERRGAQMGTLADFHPDLPAWISLKDKAGVMTQFNLSILVSDAFMSAVAEDEQWMLYHAAQPEPSTRDPALVALDFWDEYTGCQAYVYSVWRARDLWEMITRHTYEYSEPGIIWIDRVNSLNNLYYREQIRCTNPCVTGDTLILTSEGHRPIQDLVGKEVSVWNGNAWSKVTPYSTGVNSLMEITFSNGQTVRCTPYHKWVLSNGDRVEARDLKVQAKLQFCELPDIQGSVDYATDAYSQGFYCGDGTKNATESNLYKHDEGIRNRLVGKIWDRNCVAQPGHRWQHGVMLPKDFVPSEGSVDYCINWLAGLLDADGCVSKKKDTKVLEISAKDRNFLRKTGLMLNRLGVNYRMWDRSDAGLKTGSNGKEYMSESTAALMISWKYVHKLVQLGLNCARVDLSSFRVAPKGVARVGHRVVAIRHLQHVEETFCLTEPKNNTFIANGVLTGNCGEQPLPPNACCNLAANNLALMVANPFTDDAYFDYNLLRRVTHIGMRFLDNVTDVTLYPLEAQRLEQEKTRRTGLGFTGLATAMAMMGIRYGSGKSARFASEATHALAHSTYEASQALAEERGAFPDYSEQAYWHESEGFAATRFRDTPLFGKPMRNGVCLTLAPTGTTSVTFGNVDSGLEPIFGLEFDRNVRQADNTYKPSKTRSLTKRLWDHLHPGEEIPRYVTASMAMQLSVQEHIIVQEACQEWIDSSISKTINVPKDMPYEDFVAVYDLAYEAGLKGCTTYRPSDVRGSILVSSDATPVPTAESAPVRNLDLGKRPALLDAKTAKIKWPALNSALYLTLSRLEDGSPFEMFLHSKDQRTNEWMTTATLFISWLFRLGMPLECIAAELEQVHALDGYIVEGRYRPSLVSYIGQTLRKMDDAYTALPPTDATSTTSADRNADCENGQPENMGVGSFAVGKRCPQCNSYRVVVKQGCESCVDCGHSKCS